MRTRYCQRCSEPQRLDELTTPQPCHRCGGTNFDAQPKLHSSSCGVYVLVDWPPNVSWRGCASDADFLRANGIDPEGGM